MESTRRARFHQAEGIASKPSVSDLVSVLKPSAVSVLSDFHCLAQSGLERKDFLENGSDLEGPDGVGRWAGGWVASWVVSWVGNWVAASGRSRKLGTSDLLFLV